MKEDKDMNNLSDNFTKEIDELFDEEASKTMEEAVDAVIQASETADDMIFDVEDDIASDDDYIDPADLFDSVTEKDVKALADDKPKEVPENEDDDEEWSVTAPVVKPKKNSGKKSGKKGKNTEKKAEEPKKTEKPEKSEKPEIEVKAEKAEKQEKTEKVEKPEKEIKSEKEVIPEKAKDHKEPEQEVNPEKNEIPENEEKAETDEPAAGEDNSDDDFVPVLDLSDVDMEYKEPEKAEDEGDTDKSDKSGDAVSDSEDDASDEMFDDINLALSEQVEKQLGPSFAELLEEEENASERAKERAEKEENENEDDDDQKGIWALIPLWLKIVLGILLFLVLLGLFLLFTKPGHAIVSKIATKFVTSQVQTENPNEVQHQGEENLSGDVSVLNTPTPNPDNTGEPQQEATPTPLPTVAVVDNPFEEDTSVINILLIGEENYYHEFRGRSDAMMVASLDKDGGDLKLVSFMRDMYVEIPGYSDNKLNAAYAIGGAPLLMQTIEKNFGVKCDGYVLIQYDGFETIVDSLGGLDISLTQEEAEYLNKTDYISKPEQRNVVPGKQHMTGAQVLGYCRIRKVDTANGLKYDYGRTYRQRLVLSLIFEKYKSKGITDLYSIMTKCLKYVTISEGLDKTIEECLQAVVDKSMYNLATYRVPIDEVVDGKTVKHYTSTTINGQQVICVYPDTAQILHDILYGVKDE